MNSVILASEPNPLGFEWAEFVLVLIVFGALVWLIARFVVPAFEKTFDQRRNEIEGGIARAEQAQAEAGLLLEQYNAQLAQARAEAADIREDARAEAQQILEQLRASAQEESARIIARGEEQLAAQRNQVIRELRREIGTLAVELAEKIIVERLADDVAVRRTVDAFLADLEQHSSAGQA